MRKPLLYTAGTLLLAVLVSLVVWQGSFTFGEFAPTGPEHTLLFWAVSTLIFILTVTLSFMLARNFIKLYVERRNNREGSRIRSKLVIGALALTVTPVVFLVIFSVHVLNRNIDKWFSKPADTIKTNFIDVGIAIDRESQAKTRALADWMATLPETAAARAGHAPKPDVLQTVCLERGIAYAAVRMADGQTARLCESDARGHFVQSVRGDLVVRTPVPLDLSRIQSEVSRAVGEYNHLAAEKKTIRRLYVGLLLLITLFILFVATWLALFLAKQISVPISALLGAAREVRTGNLGYRVRVNAIDELASLVRAFNEMTEDLEANSRELENRRRFTEAILESIPTGVISLSAEGHILRVNRALKGLIPAEQVEKASNLADLFPAPEDTAEIRYLMNRARRVGVAASQLEMRSEHQVVHLSVTVAALHSALNSGYVVVLEDTSDMLRAQRAAAWHEVARRIAHELKNPLTPISLCSERIALQLRRPANPATREILLECSHIISSEVETVRALVDEFSQFARFPSAQPVPSDLNDVVENGLAVFAGRLDGVQVIKNLAPDLPPLALDREQWKRLVVNLVDNAAEAMRSSLVRRLYVGTCLVTPETVELTIADTGCGVSPEQKEKLFLPYFTTKNRGTGLGLAIVSQIVSEHHAQIRVEDNSPCGARFVLELSTGHALENAPEPATIGARA